MLKSTKAAKEHRDRNGGTDRKGMTEGDGQESEKHEALRAAVKPKGDGEQPSHGRIDSVKKAEANQCQPGPGRLQG